MLSLVGEWHFASTTVFIRGMTPCLCHHFLPSVSKHVLFLPEPLSITRMVDYIPLPLKSPDLQAQSATDCGVRGMAWRRAVLFRNLYCICCFKVWRLLLLWMEFRSLGAGISTSERMRLVTPLPLLLLSYLWLWVPQRVGGQSHVCCLPLMLLGSLKLWAQRSWSEGLDL